MADKSKIEWTDATWNPIRGCSRVSEGCRHCYAEGVAARFSKPGQAYEGLADFKIIGQGTKNVRSEAHWTGKIQVVPELMDQPLRWRKPRKIFVNSMSDLFHEGVSDEVLLGLFTVMANSHIATHGWDQTHVFQVLTKRPERMQKFVSRLRWRLALGIVEIGGRGHMLNYLPELEGERDVWVSLGGVHRVGKKDQMPKGWVPPQIWLGVSVEDQKTADARIPLLLQTPAAVRWVSAEPLLGPVDLPLPDPGCNHPHCDGIDSSNGPDKVWVCRVCDGLMTGDSMLTPLHWVVVGGESGPGARPMHPDWARQLRDQCQEWGVPFFFKQWGEWKPLAPMYASDNGGEDPEELMDGSCPDRTISLEQSGIETPLRDNGYYEYQPPFGTWLMERVGKRAAGRILDGREWNEYPSVSRPSQEQEAVHAK